MKPLLVLAAISLFLRFSGAVARHRPSLAVSWLGWLTVGLAGWLVASAFGAWFPYWAGLAPAAIAAALSRRLPLRVSAPVVDLAAVTLTACLSTPPLPAGLFAVLAGVYVGVGVATDLLVAALDRRVRYLLPALVVAALVGLIPNLFPRHLFQYLVDQPERIPRLGVTTALKAERVDLPHGEVAWLDRPHGTPKAGAVFFHGYNALGAQQGPALAVRRALLDNGFMVLSVDYPGFGDSPAPGLEADVAAWDPLPGELQAFDALRERLGTDKIFLIGHSMGTGEVARMMASDRPLLGAAMLGGGISIGKPIAGPFWYARFNKLHRFDPPFPQERFEQIAGMFHDKVVAVRAMPEQHAPLLFVEFVYENPDLTLSRDAFFDLIPGEKRKALCRASHYLSSTRIDSFLVGDPIATLRLSRLFRANLDLNATPAAGGLEKKSS